MNSSSSPAGTRDAIVRELHGALHWMLIMVAFLLYLSISRLSGTLQVMLAEAGEESRGLFLMDAVATTLFAAATIAVTCSLIRYSIALLKLRGDSGPDALGKAFSSHHTFWRTVFFGGMAGLVACVLAIPVKVFRTEKSLEKQQRWEAYLEMRDADREEMQAQKAAAQREWEAKQRYLRKLEEDYYRQKKARELEQGEGKPAVPAQESPADQSDFNKRLNSIRLGP